MEWDRDNIGRRVTLTSVRHFQFVGQTGVIKKAIKSRQAYNVQLDDGRTYEAYAANVSLMELVDA